MWSTIPDKQSLHNLLLVNEDNKWHASYSQEIILTEALERGVILSPQQKIN